MKLIPVPVTDVDRAKVRMLPSSTRSGHCSFRAGLAYRFPEAPLALSALAAARRIEVGEEDAALVAGDFVQAGELVDEF